MSGSKQKAIELVASFKDFVNPYMGSGMLSNTYDNDAILFQSKKCAHVCVDKIIESEPHYILLYDNVRNNIDLVTVEDIFKDAK